MLHHRIRAKTKNGLKKIRSFGESVGYFFKSPIRLVFVVFLGLVVIVFLIMRLIGFFQSQSLPESPVGSLVTPIYFSFTDLFSGTSWINLASTTMYQDKKENSFVLPPVFKWQKFNQPISNVGFINKEADGGLVKCIGSNCLKISQNNLFFNGKKISIPGSLNRKNIAGISIGALSTKWVAGFVSTNGSGTYNISIFTFDGNNFSDVTADGTNLFASAYVGTLGFGGNDDNWIAIYGAYQGSAYRFRKSGDSYEVEDISKYFNVRVEAGGFEPSIIGPVIEPSGSESIENWYVWSLTANNPTLVKIFGVSGGNIIGAVDFRDEILPGAPIGALFKFDSSSKDSIVLDALVTDENNIQKPYLFTDYGFNRSKQYKVISANGSSYPWPVGTATISPSGISEDGVQVKFFVSSNSRDWTSAVLGEKIQLDRKQPGLFWMAEVEPGSGIWSSPFFDYIRIDTEVIPK